MAFGFKSYCRFYGVISFVCGEMNVLSRRVTMVAGDVGLDLRIHVKRRISTLICFLLNDPSDTKLKKSTVPKYIIVRHG